MSKRDCTVSTELEVRLRDRSRTQGMVAPAPDPTLGLIILVGGVLASCAAVLSIEFLIYWELELLAGYTVPLGFKIVGVLFGLPTGLLIWVWGCLWLGPPHLTVETETSFAGRVILEMALLSPLGRDAFMEKYIAELDQRAMASPLGPEEFMRRHHARLARGAYFKHEGNDNA